MEKELKVVNRQHTGDRYLVRMLSSELKDWVTEEKISPVQKNIRKF
jgi:DNA gyrase inhibitor GyrI